MPNNFRGYVNNVDELIQQTPFDRVLGHYGLPLTYSAANEYRMKCVFNEACSDSKYGNLSVKLDAAKRIFCHTCETKGNLLTLLHGLETHRPPESGVLRGQEFKAAVAKLKEINGLVDSASTPNRSQSDSARNSSPQKREDPAPTPSTPLTRSGEASKSQAVLTPESNAAQVVSGEPETKLPKLVNIPLRRHDKEVARSLETLYQELIVDVSQMSPEAAAYVRKRPWMTPELMRKWGCGWIPGNGRSLFRKNYFVYTHRNVRGEVVSYSGRDLSFEKKWGEWIRDGKPEGKKPNKHRYVSGYHRGSELYGAMRSRLDEPTIRESLNKHGLVIVEGMNDVMRLDELGICSVGICSNRATDTQIATITKSAQRVSNNRVMLLPDCDEEGEAGFKDLLWNLAEARIDARLGVTSQMFDGKFADKQPENLTEIDLRQIADS